MDFRTGEELDNHAVLILLILKRKRNIPLKKEKI